MSKISELSDGGSLQSTDYLIAVRSGGNVKVRPNGAVSGTTGQFSTSLNVDGTVTADGLTVDGGVSTLDSGTASPLILERNGGTDANTLINFNQATEDWYLGANTSTDFVLTRQLNADIDKALSVASNGDISFYEDTGTTPRLFWDASAEALGIGTSSLTSNASLSIAQGGVHVDGGASGGASQVILSTGASSGSNFGQISNTGTRWSLGYGGTQQTVGTEVLTWNSSGNVGIGTSSPTFLADIQKSSEGNILRLKGSTDNRYLDFTTFTVGTVNGAGFKIDATSSDGTIAFATAGNERMRIDSSGSVGIGCTPDSTVSLDVQNLSASSNNVLLRIKNATNLEDSGLIIEGANGGAREYRIGVNTIANSSDLTFSGPTGYRYYIGASEAMRIDSSGNLLVGTTTSNGTNADGFNLYEGSGGSRLYIAHANGTANGTQYAVFNYNSGKIGDIVQSGTTAVLYNISSDARLKENIADAEDASELIDAIQVRSFDWKVDGSHQKYGMVAQELVTVAPEAVSVPEDPEEMMGVDYSKLVPMLVKEIQSLRARVAQLEGV